MEIEKKDGGIPGPEKKDYRDAYEKEHYKRAYINRT